MSGGHTQGTLTYTVSEESKAVSIFPKGKDSRQAITLLCHDALRDEDNARRLVACWNACQHMPIVSIEELSTIGGVPALVVYGDVVKNERDELLTALEYHQQQTRPIQRTIDVIAKVKGGAA